MTNTTHHINGSLYNKAAISVYQSSKIHPDWDLDTHLAYLESEEYIDTNTPISYCYWPEGPKEAPLKQFVKSWLNRPERFKEICTEILLKVNEL